jgi:hypothetical protein
MSEKERVRLDSGDVGIVRYERHTYRIIEYAGGSRWTIQCWANSTYDVPGTAKSWGDLATGFTTYAEARATIDMYTG